MKTIKINLFEFSELSEEVQKKLIEKNYDINIFEDWHDDLLSDFKTELAEAGFNDATIHYSGFSSQGDGLCFDATIDVNKFAETTNEKRIAKLIDKGEIDNYSIGKNSYSNHYSHERTRYVDSPAVSQINLLTNVTFLEAKINQKRLTLCREFYRRLEEEYDSLQSEESIKETLNDSEATYLENGQMFNE